MIRRTYEQVLKSSLDGAVVATDDQRIFNEVRNFGGRVVMTSADHKSGTDRCCEALGLIWGNFDAVVNIQGDEPFIDPRQIDQVAELIRRSDTCLATLAKRIADPSRIDNPNTVKVVFDHEGNALYFSRNPLPYVRGVDKAQWFETTDFYQHIGIYAYKADTLRAVAAMPPSRLEQMESLEQLRWIENGLRIRVALTDLPDSISIDTPDDLLNISQDLCQ